ncbi:MAG: hypothetical protein GY851_25960 [bacterium]|nr:hypothetical protein [bacterium]
MAASILLWVLFSVTSLLGIIGFLFPKATRRLISVFLHRTSLRRLGVLMLVAGALLFRYSPATAVPILAKALGFAVFVVGGTQLLIPDLAVVLNEWWVGRRLTWERLISLVYLAIAAFFFTSIGPAAIVEPVINEYKTTYRLLFKPKTERAPSKGLLRAVRSVATEGTPVAANDSK